MKENSHEKKSQRVKFGGTHNDDITTVSGSEIAEQEASVLISSPSDASSNSQQSANIHSSANQLDEKLAALAVDGATRHLSHGNTAKSCSCSARVEFRVRCRQPRAAAVHALRYCRSYQRAQGDGPPGRACFQRCGCYRPATPQFAR
ncbi:hypothetical protein AYI70_g8100 [Smittium culicis]|uniref:Uncharacterized protein n=1 Tax=Smittium culicis TaxID=133412 RepID=A0A1R1WXE6_9FUNG|nr:hypothetical protein AYI70_g12455 [Smittium culicis]OMJ14095.1 hypothetical protein AYI70_g8100 [Smittium culicis]